MNSHPCDGHSCDHCFLCDVVGICCMTISPEQNARLEADDRAQRERLRLAIGLEVVTVPSLGELVRLDVERQRSARSLSAPSPFVLSKTDAQPSPHDRKESSHVAASRAAR